MELDQKGVVVAMEIGNVPHTIGSQVLFTLSDNNGLKDSVSLAEEGEGNNGKGGQTKRYLSLGTVAEDSQKVLSKLNRAYCDDDGRPFADIRIQRALVLHDPFEDPPGMQELLRWRGVVAIEDSNGSATNDDLKDGYPLPPQSPTYDKPPEEIVPVRIQADDTTLFATAGWDDQDDREDSDEEDEAARQKRLELQEKQEEEWRQRQDTSRAVMLEMLGDRPDAEIQAPEDVLFVCKLNPLTNDEDLELIFSRFDPKAKAEIIRDPDSGTSLQYAFVEFASKEACNEAYLKMNNALVDDRRIRVDFSQSVAKVWDRYHKRYRKGDRSGMDRNVGMGRGGGVGGRGRGGRGRGGGRGGRHHGNNHSRDRMEYRSNGHGRNGSDFDNFGRAERPRDLNGSYHNHHSTHHHESRDSERRESRRSRSRSGSRDSRRRDRRPRRSRSRSDDSSEDSRRRKKHHKKHRHRESSSSRRKRSRSRSRDREKKRKKKHHRHHHRRRERSDDDDDRKRDRHDRDRKHHRHRRDDRSRSRS